MKKIIVVWASSWIWKAIAEIFFEEWCSVWLVWRRTSLLEKISSRYPKKSFIKTLDITKVDETTHWINALIEEMWWVDSVVIAAWIGFLNPIVAPEEELKTVQTNVVWYTWVITNIYKYFVEKKRWTLVAITSIASLRWAWDSPSYSASKAFQSNYIRWIRHNTKKLWLPIHVMEVQPWFVDTKMAQWDSLFWVASPEKAAKQIYNWMMGRKEHIYVTKRWRIIWWIMKLLPDFLYRKLG